MLFEERIIVRPVDGMETPGFQIAQPWGKAFADQCKEPEDMIAGAAGIDEMLTDFQYGFVIEQSIEWSGDFAIFARSFQAPKCHNTNIYQAANGIIMAPDPEGIHK